MNPLLPRITAALAAAGIISTAQAQVQIAGSLLINVDATTAPLGPITSIANAGTQGGFFEARGGGANNPVVARANNNPNGQRGVRMDGSDFLQHVVTVGGALVPADATLVGANPTCSIEAWVLNPDVSGEETVVSWGKRGGPDGSNMSFNYGWDDRWGAVGHWGAADIGWDPCCNSGTDPQGVPMSGQWHHLVYTYDGTTTRVYADGALKNSESIGLNTTAGTPVTIGAQLEADGVTVTAPLRASMTIGRLRIHSEALSTAQIANNYNFELNDFPDPGSPLPFGPIHRYSFLNPSGPASSGSVISDSIGTAHGVVRGNGATFTGNRLVLPGGSSVSQAYVDLPNRLLSTNSADTGGSGRITLEGWVKVTAGRNWGRIFDFGNGTAGELTGPGGGAEGRDYVFFSGSNGTNPNRHEYGLRNLIPPTGSDVGAGYDTANFNRDFHFAFTWDESNGQILIYENGALALTTAVNPAADRFSAIDDVNVWLGRSNWTGDENMQGEYDEFRIYNRVLPPEQIRASYVAGPDQLATAEPVSFVVHPQSQTIPELGAVTFTASAQGAPPIGLQWYKDDVALSGQTGNTLSLSSVPLSDNNARIYVVGSNYISGSSFTATSQVAVLTVNADGNPPTLVQVRVNGRTTLELVLSEAIRSADAAATGNFILSGPPGAPSIVGAAPGANGRRVLLTLDGPLECATYTLTVSGVHDVSAAGNVIAPNSTISFFNYAPGRLSHRYTFNRLPAVDATGTAVDDAIGTSDGVVRSGGRPTSLTGDRVTLSGGPSSTSPYVDLPNYLLSTNSVSKGGSGKVSLEGWVKVTGNHSWSRIFDFGSSGPCCGTGSEVIGAGGGGEGIDYFFYSAQVGTAVTRRRVDVTNRDGGGAAGVEYNVANFNQDMHFVITWDDASHEVNTYEDGVLVGTFPSQNAMSDINDVNVWLGRSNWAVDENMEGEFDEFRIYNDVLSPAAVQLNRVAGPDNNFGAALSLSLVVSNQTMITNTVQRSRVLVNFSNLGAQDVAASGCAIFESTDDTVVHVTPDGILQALATGSATVTVRFAGFSESMAIDVTGDITPPTLLKARAYKSNVVEVLFSEPVVFAGATDPANYTVSDPDGDYQIFSVSQSSDPARVLIQLVAPLRCEYVTVTVNDVTDQSPTPNVIDPNPSSISFMNFAPQGLLHRYTFNNSLSANALSGTIIPDTVGSADGVLLGGGGGFTGNRVVLNGGSSATAAYIDLPNGLLSSRGVANGGSGEISVEGWVKITGPRTWSRIFDFGSTIGGEVFGPGGGGEGRDYFMLSAVIGGDPNFRRTELRNEDPGGGGTFTIDHPTTGFNNDSHFVVTWKESTGQIRIYENGAQVSSMTVPTRMSDINDVNVWLGRSNWTGDENMQGEFDEFRIYDRVLSASEIQFNQNIGPENALGQPLAVRVTLPSVVTLGQTVTPTVTADFTTMSNVDLTIAGCFTVESSDNSILSADNSAGVFHAVGGGAAVATVRFNGFSDSASVTVFVPPVPEIKRQPCANSICLIVPSVTPPPPGGSILAAQDFNSSDGGCTVLNINNPFEGPWTYNSGAGTWSSAGQGAELGRPPSTRLTCPPVTLTQSGNVRISFNHRYSFEFDGTAWDGGLVQVSVNGGVFITVPALAFVQNGYNGVVYGDSRAEIKGQGAFISTSAGYDAPSFITSIADIGCLSAGDTVSVRFLAAYDTNTRNGDPAWEIDNISVIEGAQNGEIAKLAVWALPGAVGDTLSVQWQKSVGGGPYAPVSGGTNGFLAFAPNVEDNGNCYRAIITEPESGTSVTSAVACLTVTQPNTAPRFTCGPGQTVPQDSGPQTVTGWATDIVPHSLPPLDTVIKFNSVPPNSQLFGVAAVTGGVLHLTDAANDSFGAISLNLPAATVFQTFSAGWKSLIGGGTSGGADGYSFNVGDNIHYPAEYNNPGEEGSSSGLAVTFDTWDNGTDIPGGDVVGVEIRWQGARVASAAIPKDNPGNGVYLRKNTFVDASLTVDATGLATLNYDGTVVSAQLPGYTGISANRLMFGGRTGGANDNHWIDDLTGSSWINNFLSVADNPALAEQGQTVSFLVSNDNPGLFSAQPAVSPDGSLTYTPAPNATGVAHLTVVAKDNGGTNCGGNDTSTSCAITINVNSVNQPPTARIVATPLANFLPYLPNLVLIAADGSNACVVLDGSTSSDPDSPASALTYSWYLQPSPTPFASGVRVTNCVDLGTYTYVLAVTDPQGGVGTDSLTIDVLTPCEAEGALILIIYNSGLPRNVQQPLVSSVKAACASYEKNGVNAGINQLQAFQNKVRTHVRPIDLPLAYQLEAAAQVIIDALSAP